MTRDEMNSLQSRMLVLLPVGMEYGTSEYTITLGSSQVARVVKIKRRSVVLKLLSNVSLRRVGKLHLDKDTTVFGPIKLISK